MTHLLRGHYGLVELLGEEVMGTARGDASLVDCALKRYAALFAYRIATPADFVSTVGALLPQAPSVLATFGVRG